jgi:hypothetical protein
MNSTQKELQEWMSLGKRAFRRIPQTEKPTIPKRHKVVRKRASMAGHIVEFDKVVEY